MTVKRGEKLSNHEKKEMLLDAVKILKCGDKEIVDAFAESVNLLLELCRSQKKIKELIKKRVYHTP